MQTHYKNKKMKKQKQSTEQFLHQTESDHILKQNTTGRHEGAVMGAQVRRRSH